MSSDFSTEKACIPVAKITKHENGQVSVSRRIKDFDEFLLDEASKNQDPTEYLQLRGCHY